MQHSFYRRGGKSQDQEVSLTRLVYEDDNTCEGTSTFLPSDELRHNSILFRLHCIICDLGKCLALSGGSNLRDGQLVIYGQHHAETIGEAI